MCELKLDIKIEELLCHRNGKMPKAHSLRADNVVRLACAGVALEACRQKGSLPAMGQPAKVDVEAPVPLKRSPTLRTRDTVGLRDALLARKAKKLQATRTAREALPALSKSRRRKVHIAPSTCGRNHLRTLISRK